MESNPLLLETIRLQDGVLPFLAYHQHRLELSRAAHFGKGPAIDLEKAIAIPDDHRRGRFKVRVLYGAQLERIEIVPYAIRPVHSLQLVVIQGLAYTHKYADRLTFEQLFQQRTYGDDVLMVRNGLLTDTSYANVALFDGRKWYTPAAPLLPGTARARFLAAGLLQPAAIRVGDLSDFREMRLINAMMDWEEGPVVSVAAVKW